MVLLIELGGAQCDAAADEGDDHHRQLHAAGHAPALRPRQWRALLPAGGRVCGNCGRVICVQ